MTQQVRQSAIRWPGVGAFFLIVGLLVAFSWLMLDSIIKWTLERSVGTLNGAEVNIESVAHGWMPLRIQINGVQVTDPLQPERNRVVIGELRGDLELGELLIGRVIFDQLNVTGVRVDQPRESAGEVYQTFSKDNLKTQASANWDALKMNLPSMEEVMAQVDLQTDKIAARAEENFEAQKASFEAARDALPSSEQLKSYEDEVKALVEGKVENIEDLNKRREQLDALKERFRSDREAVKNFKTQLETAKEVLTADIQALREAPAQDLEKIKSFMRFDASGLENITALIFGEQIRSWSKYVLLAYEQLGPMLERSEKAEEVEPPRGEGVWFSFAEASAPPSFLVRKAKTEFAFGDAVLDVDWQNITHQHIQLGQPTTFQARADNNSLWQSFNLNGELAMTASGFDARQQWQLRGAQLNDISLSDRPEFIATLAATLLDSEGAVAVRDGILDGDAAVRLAALDINASGEDRWAQLLSTALGKLERLDIRTTVGGSLRAPSLSLNSDLDQQLGDALQSTAMDAARDKLADVETQLTEKMNTALAKHSPQLAGLVDLEGLASSKDAQLEDLLKAKLEDAAKQKLEDEVKKRLGDLLGGG